MKTLKPMSPIEFGEAGQNLMLINEVLFDKWEPIKVKGKLFGTLMRPTLLYKSECWANKESQEYIMQVAEMCMFGYLCHEMTQSGRNDATR